MTTLKTINVKSFTKDLRMQVAFGRMWGGYLFDVYAKISLKQTTLVPDPVPRKRRLLRLKEPEVHFFYTKDSVNLRLIHYNGGTKGPIILCHGGGVSSFIYTIDTIETNLTEFLFAHGYDVWLLDWRGSIELPSSRTSYTMDDVAKYDIPAAVEQVLTLTGAKSAQILGHCIGCTIISMSILAGYTTHIKSVVLSQAGMHLVGGVWNKVKSFAHVTSISKELGFSNFDIHDPKQFPTILTEITKVMVGDFHCQNKVCQQTSLFYGPLWEHSALNALTHDNVAEVVGVCDLTLMEHIATVVEKGKLTSADQKENYLTEDNVKRLNIPICFIHGEENHCFVPKGTMEDIQLLQKVNKPTDPNFYKRHLIKKYGHLDCIFGKNAASDVFPFIVQHLDETAKDSLSIFVKKE